MNINFWRKIDTLIKHRIGLIDALKLIAKESRLAKEKEAVEKIIASLQTGMPFSQAIGSADSTVEGVLLLGERSGNLPEAIQKLTERLERARQLKSQLRSALIYPTMVVLTVIVMALLLSLVVLPRFRQLFTSMGVGQLPPLTQGVISVGEWMGQWGLITIILLGVGCFIVLHFAGAKKRAQLKWKLPLAGGLWRNFHQEQFFAGLGGLLSAGAPLDEALRLLGKSLRGNPLAEFCKVAAPRIAEGDTLSNLMTLENGFDGAQRELVAIAERSGALADSSLRSASLMQESLQSDLKTVIGLLEPSLVIAMAGFVALMVISLFLPLGPLVGRLSEGM